MKIPSTRLGVLGGGQLGKMMALAAGNWHLPFFALDTSRDFPAGSFCTGFEEGNFNHYEDVLRFGKMVDVLTIEIEHVNIAALLQLEREGRVIHPRPAALQIIKDKGLQKQFYIEKGLPTASFELFETPEAIREAVTRGAWKLPFVQKSRTDGYDGRGVSVIRTEQDLAEKLLPGASLLEEMVPIEKEIALVVARNKRGETAAFPLVEMLFDPDANLVTFLACPARVSPEIAIAAEALALAAIEAYDICGLLAVELFLTPDQQLLVNEVAPRPHNSGHHTIESCNTSQFEQHIRGVLDLPLGSTSLKVPAAVMLNLLGEPGYEGPALYENLDQCLGMEGVHVHLYGKATTKPFRKMGHVTALGETPEAAMEKALKVKELLKVKV
ncbi:MAG: 5-(carboxyamino)imidazole ribonucleotide synthase [Saprospiraceae bacterium]|nr:5-(carboxyamino)imidazole ribonucleotide synthase [Saprospiraceae bacterium]